MDERPPHSFDESAPAILPRAAVIVTLASVTLALLLNAYQADLIKGPLFIAGAVFAAGCGLTTALWRRQLTIVTTPVDVPLILLLLIVAVQTLRSPDPHTGREAALFWGACGVMYVAGTHFFHSLKSIRELFVAFAAITLLVVVIGAAQWTFPDRLPVDFYVGQKSRIPSTLGNASLTAAYAAAMAPLLLATIPGADRFLKLMVSLLLAGLCTLLFATGSRGGIVAAMAGLVLALSLQGKRLPILMIQFSIVAVVVAGAIALTPGLRDRFIAAFGTGVGSPLARRTVFWSAGWKAFAAAPFTGYGTGSFGLVMPLFRSPDYWIVGSEDIVAHAHNEVLELAVDFGVPGILLWLMIMSLTLHVGVRTALHSIGAQRAFGAALVAALAGILIDNMAGISLRHPAVAPYAWLVMGLLWSPAFHDPRVKTTHVRVSLHRATAAIPILAAALWAFLYVRHSMPVFAAESHLMNGYDAAHRGDLTRAADEFTEAYRADPGNPRTAIKAAEVLHFQGHSTEALAAVDRLLRRSPHFPGASLLHSEILVHLGRPRDALVSIDRELALRATPEAFAQKASIARTLGEREVEKNALTSQIDYAVKSSTYVRTNEACMRLLGISTSAADSSEALASFNAARAIFGERVTDPRK